MAKPKIKKKTAPKVTPGVEARMVELSLQHPEFGAKRLLPLLNSENIDVSASTVYNILRRSGLQNRDKRLARIEAQQGAATPLPTAINMSPPPAVPASMPTGLAAPVSEPIEEKVRPPRGREVPGNTHRATAGKPWFLTLIDSVLMFLIVFLAFHTWQNVSLARLEPEDIELASPEPAIAVTKPEAAVSSLNDYRMISKRNLFNVSKKEAPDPKKAVTAEKLIPAQKELGLKLVGTVVAYDSMLSRAFIENRQTRKQESYREGDKAGGVVIKKVLRNKVIIGTAAGDRLLTLAIESSGKNLKNSTAAPHSPRSSTPGSPSPSSPPAGARTRHISLDRQEVEDSLANVDRLLQELTISPYLQFQKPAGFRISNITRDSIFRKMGLSSKDVIVGVNDRKITSPDQAAEFIQALAEGGEVTIRAKRRRRTRRIILNFE